MLALAALGMVLGQSRPSRLATGWAVFAVAALLGIVLFGPSTPASVEAGILAVALMAATAAAITPAASSP